MSALANRIFDKCFCHPNAMNHFFKKINFQNQYCQLLQSRQFTDSSISQEAPAQLSITGTDRLAKLCEYYSNQPSGLFLKIYLTQIFDKKLFETGMASVSNDIHKMTEIVTSAIQIRAYVAGKDGLNTVEREAIITDAYLWCPSLKMSGIDVNELCDKSLKLTDDELSKICDIFKKKASRKYRKGILLMSLVGASLDESVMMKHHNTNYGAKFKYGITSKNIEAFEKIAKLLDVDDRTTREVYQLYTYERKLREKYDELFMVED